jgi:hypothetical protein
MASCWRSGGVVNAADGHDRVHLFDPIAFEATPPSSGWEETADMAYDRYYPTATLLPDGRILATHGRDTESPSVFSPIPEIYDQTLSNPWTSLTSAPTHSNFQMYPFMTVVPGPSTRVLHSGPGLDYGTLQMHMLVNLDGTGTPTWNAVGLGATIPGSEAVPIGGGKVLKSGGVDIPNTPLATNKAELITLGTSGVTQVAGTGAMKVARDQQSLVALPNGAVVAIGGQTKRVFGAAGVQEAVYATETYTPSTAQWCYSQPMTHRAPTIPRMYHSTALLLPDGRVLVAGGDAAGSAGCPQPTDLNFSGATVNCVSADFYKPPYLFKPDDSEIQDSDRPTIQGVTRLGAGGAMYSAAGCTYGNGTAISSACLIRPAAVTHGLDMEQRFIPLSVVSIGGSAAHAVSLSASLSEAPPGHYMLFVMNNAAGNHPSKATFVEVWGIPESSLSITVTHHCQGSAPRLTFTATWKSTVPTEGTDGLVLYPPGTSCGTTACLDPPQGAIVATGTPNGVNHSVTTTVSCINGEWKVAVASAVSGGCAATPCRPIQVTCLSCCTTCCSPPCEFD